MTPEDARYLWNYNAETGSITWRVADSNKIVVGQEAGYFHRNRGGNKILHRYGKDHYATKIIWLIVHGREPLKGYVIDHINRDPTDNRLVNLRECTKSQNGINRGNNTNNRTGYKGVSYNKRDRKFVAWIKCNYVNNYLGSYDTAKEAAQAYKMKAIELFGEFADDNQS